jgi:hypothetical protein
MAFRLSNGSEIFSWHRVSVVLEGVVVRVDVCCPRACCSRIRGWGLGEANRDQGRSTKRLQSMVLRDLGGSCKGSCCCQQAGSRDKAELPRPQPKCGKAWCGLGWHRTVHKLINSGSSSNRGLKGMIVGSLVRIAISATPSSCASCDPDPCLYRNIGQTPS